MKNKSNNNLKKLFVKSIFYVCISFSIVITLSMFIKPLRLFILDNRGFTYAYGDLFDISKLSKFKTTINVRSDDTDDTLNIYNADIITMGDSFFNSSLHSDIFAKKLQDKVNKPVFNVPRDDLSQYNDNPLSYLERIDYKKGEEKYLILGGVERYSISRANSYKVTNLPKQSSFDRFKTSFKNTMTNSRLQYISYSNRIISKLDSFKYDLQFDLLDEINPKVKAYSENPNMLFYYEEVDFSKQKHSDNLIKLTSDNIKFLADTLKEKYNIKLIYIFFPDKYSLYGDLSDETFVYDNYLPRLNDNLENLGVASIDMYTIYKDYKDKHPDQYLYYFSDTHYNNKAQEMGVDQIYKLLKNSLN